MNRTMSVIVGLVLMLVVGGYVYHARQVELNSTPVVTPGGSSGTSAGSESTNPNGGTTSTTGNTGSTATPGGITFAQVTTHSGRTSCWSAINGFVYDLTSWIPHHPGGEDNILRICGKDGSSLFNAQHGGESQPATILAGFKIGTLAE